MTTDTTPTPPAEAGSEAGPRSRSWAEVCDQAEAGMAALRGAIAAIARLTAERDAANARAETAETKTAAVTRAARYLFLRPRCGADCPVGQDACLGRRAETDATCVDRLAEHFAAEALAG